MWVGVYAWADSLVFLYSVLVVDGQGVVCENSSKQFPSCSLF